jgi:hypothetical protein
MIDNGQEERERRILEEALVSPKAALMQLSLEIDRELRKLLVSTGVLGRYLALVSPTPPKALKLLSSVEGAKVPEELRDTISEFWFLRNTVAHQDSDVPLVTFDLGLSILRVLRSIPRPSYIVRKTNVPLYADHHCQNQRQGVRGVWVETFGADSMSQGTRIYPTTREYTEGMSVGWEWNPDTRQGWGDTWYKDPETGNCTQAWSGSMEFIGRDINEV